MRTIIILFLLITFEAAADESVFDCSESTTLTSNLICSDELLMAKHKALMIQMDILNKIYFEIYNRPVEFSKDWGLKRNLCKTKNCLTALYSIELYSLAKTSQIRESHFTCGATTNCTLQERYYVGIYNGKQIVVDKLEIVDCFKGCSQPWIDYILYELKDGSPDKNTLWKGSFTNPNMKIDHKFKRMQKTRDSRTLITDRVVFGVDKPGCPDCYETIFEVVRTQDGWKRIKNDKKL